jgi:hypothetical protein
MKPLFVCAAGLLTTVAAMADGCPTISTEALSKAMNISPDLLRYVSIEVADCSNITLDRGFATFGLNEVNEKVHKGVRSEVLINYPFKEGDTIEYAWSVMLPTEAAPGGDAEQWWLIAQWHDQPDPAMGETWRTFKSHSPPVAITVERRNGVLGVGLNGIKGKKLDWAPVTTGRWLRVKALITWSTGEHGRATITIMGGEKPIVFEHTGQNMLNAYQHYFKAGQYRDPSVRMKTAVRLKDFTFLPR